MVPVIRCSRAYINKYLMVWRKRKKPIHIKSVEEMGFVNSTSVLFFVLQKHVCLDVDFQTALEKVNKI